MGDMLRKAYGCGGFAPYEYEWPDDWGGDVFDFEDDFPTADEMRNREQKLNTVDKVILEKIKNALKETSKDINYILFEGEISPKVDRYLYEKGYKIDRIRSFNKTIYKISW